MQSKILNSLNIVVVMLLPYMGYIKYNNTPINISLADIFLVIMGIILLINLKFFFFKKRKWILIYFGGLILSLIVSQFSGNSNAEFITAPNITLVIEILKTIVVAIYFIFAFLYICKMHKIEKILLLISYSVLPVLLVGYISFFQYFNGVDLLFPLYTPVDSRFIGTFQDPNLCSFFLNMVFFISLLNFKIQKNKYIKGSLIAIIAFVVVANILTMSRGGLLAMAMSMVFLIYLERDYFKKRLIFFMVPMVLLFLSLVCIDSMILDKTLSSYVTKRMQITSELNFANFNRFQLTKAAIEMGNDNFLLGVGKGSFPHNSYKYLGEKNENYIYRYLPHNTVASFYAQQGIIGLSIFISMYLYIMIMMIKNRSEFHHYIYALSLCWFIQSLTINTENIRFFWYFYGLILANELNNKRSRLNENTIE